MEGVRPYYSTATALAYSVRGGNGASNFQLQSRDNALQSVRSEHTIVISASIFVQSS